MSFPGQDPDFTTIEEIYDRVLRKDPNRRSAADKRVLTWRDGFSQIHQVYKDATSQAEPAQATQTASIAPQKAIAATPEVPTSTIDQLCSRVKSLQPLKIAKPHNDQVNAYSSKAMPRKRRRVQLNPTSAPNDLPIVEDDSDIDSDSTSLVARDPGQVGRRTFAQSRPLAPIAAPNAGYLHNIHGPERFGSRDALTWRNEDTPEQEEESLMEEVEYESESEQDENADANRETTANKTKKRSAASLKSRVPREVRYIFVVPPEDGHDGKRRMFKQLHDFPEDVAASLLDAGLTECRKSDERRIRHANYLAPENQTRSLQTSKCMVGYVSSKNTYERQPRKDLAHCCSTCQHKPNRLCCYLQLYKKDYQSEAVLFVYPKRNASVSWQDLQFWVS